MGFLIQMQIYWFSLAIFFHNYSYSTDQSISVRVLPAAKYFVVIVQSIIGVRLLEIPLTAVYQAYLSVIISQSLLKFMSIESVMLSNCRILCHPLLLLPSTFPCIRVFSNELALRIRWPKYKQLSIVHLKKNWKCIPQICVVTLMVLHQGTSLSLINWLYFC